MKIPYFMPISISLLVGLLIMLAGVSYWQFTYQPSTNRVASEILLPTPTSSVEEVKTFQNDQPTVKPVSQSQNTGELPCTTTYASASEILIALNNYRNTHGAGSLAWNENLAQVASMRVQQTLANGRDSHQGFIDFTNNNENFQKVGFRVLSENIGYACPLQAVHLIEQKISKSPSHDAAQRDSSWTSVGIATSNGVTSFIFGKNPY